MLTQLYCTIDEYGRREVWKKRLLGREKLKNHLKVTGSEIAIIVLYNSCEILGESKG